MKNTKILLGFIALLILVSIGIFYFNPKYPTGGSVPQTTVSTGTTTAAQVAVTSVKHPYANSASAALANETQIKWETSGYPTGAGVNINLIRKTSDSPIAYTFVRTIAANAPNTGSYDWTPQAGELAGTYYVEVTCTSAQNFDQGCSINADPILVQ